MTQYLAKCVQEKIDAIQGKQVWVDVDFHWVWRRLTDIQRAELKQLHANGGKPAVVQWIRDWLTHGGR